MNERCLDLWSDKCHLCQIALILVDFSVMKNLPLEFERLMASLVVYWRTVELGGVAKGIYDQV